MISVISATYNHNRSIEFLYESLCKQTYKDFEWIVADDGSNDGTWQRLQWFDTLKQINMDAMSQLNRGMRLSQNINRAFRRAKGDILFVIMGDSFIDDDVLQKISEEYVPGTAGSCLRLNVNKDKTFHSWDWRMGNNRSAMGKILDMEDDPAPYYRLTGNSMLLERKTLESIGWWPENYVGYGKEDHCVYLRLFRKGVKLLMYNNITVNHFWHGESGVDSENNTKLFNEELNEDNNIAR
jgi:glycosyltransferase involved in cell wall biosynthesis